MIIPRFFQYFIVFILWLVSIKAEAADHRFVVTSQALALAPNAGGQKSYALRLARKSIEYGAFANTYLVADGMPVVGVTADYRFSFCDKNCWWELFAQLGGGASTVGPVLEATWGVMVPLLPLWLPGDSPRYVPALRVDLTTQIYGIQWRGMTWSYPLWVGISVPF